MIITHIIVPTYNNEDYTIRCFESIAKHTKNYLLLWVDNGSDSQSQKKVKNFLLDKNIPFELIKNEENLGFVKATNQGMKRAMEIGGKYIVLQNNDTEVYEGWLDRMIEIAERDKQIGLVGPVASNGQGWQSISNLLEKNDEFKELPKYTDNPKEYSEILKNKQKGKIIHVYGMVAFYCTLIKSEVIEEIGFLSEDYGIGLLDDIDYCKKVLIRGWKIVLAADVFIFHNHRTTFRSKYSEEEIEKMKQKNQEIFYDKLSKIVVKTGIELQQKTKELNQKQRQLKSIKDSKSFQVGELFFRSIKKPYKLITFPYNFSKIILEKNEDIKVSVVMTAYNSEKYIVKSIESILNQTHKNLELIIVDDCSSDDTIKIIEKYQKRDDRVKLYKSYKNRGTYWAKNYAIMFATSDIITTQDSDDISDLRRLELQLKELKKNNADISFCNYIRVNEDGKKILNRGVYERVAIMGMMLRKNVFDTVGFFDSVRFAADSEMYERITKEYLREQIVHVQKSLYIALDREGSLTTTDSKIDLSKNNKIKDGEEDLSFLSLERQEYVKNYRKWHKTADKLFMPFPQQARVFEAPSKMLKSITDNNSYYVVASMATFSDRKDILKENIKNILPQVDKLNIYLNDYNYIPDFLKDKKINAVLGVDKQGDLRDNGKIFFAKDIQKNAYHFLMDDDLIYPNDYVQKMIAKLQFYNNRVVVGLHGVIFSDKIERFFENRKVYGFQNELKQDKFVNLLGTGTVAYHISCLNIDLEKFKTTGMADVWFSVLCKEQKIPLLAIERELEWLIEYDNKTPKLWDEFKEFDNVQTQIIKKNKPWNIMKL